MKRSQVIAVFFLLAILFAGIIALRGCNSKFNPFAKSNIPALPVMVFKVEPLHYTIKKTLPGRVIAYRTAEIRPQVSGIILKREFTESTDIQAGQSLYQIDPALYRATYDSAVANVANMKAKAAIAHLTLQRYGNLVKNNAISKQQYDEAAATARQADAQVKIAEADLNTAQVNLNYTKVNSPISGYIGKSNVTEGALVSASQATPLALVQQLDPIYVDMTEAVSKFEQNQQNHGTLLLQHTAMPVHITFSDGTRFAQTGYVKFSDKTVDETTGTVTLRAEFPNPLIIDKKGSQKRRLLPGMFVKPEVTFGTIENAILVPQKGVISDVNGNYTAKVVNAKGLVETRTNIQVYGSLRNYWIVTSGINAGDQIIVSGLMNLSALPPGIPVKAKIIDTTTLSQTTVDKLVADSIN